MKKLNLSVKLGNKTFYTLISILSLFAIAALVFATNSGNPSVMGHTPNEIEGLEEYIRGIASDVLSGDITCPPDPVFNSIATEKKVQAVAMPDSCKTETGCVIKQVITNPSGTTYSVRQYNYNQDLTNLWWSTYRTTGKYKNGDTIDTYIIPPSKYQYIYDDYAPASEASASQWTIRDNHASYGQTVYICSSSD